MPALGQGSRGISARRQRTDSASWGSFAAHETVSLSGENGTDTTTSHWTGMADKRKSNRDDHVEELRTGIDSAQIQIEQARKAIEDSMHVIARTPEAKAGKLPKPKN